jgi:TetR/AcrR family transcriptional regulator, mexJK operon transcriptional repressor
MDQAKSSAAASSAETGRSALKRRAIIEAATTLFLRNGYQGTSMDEIAAAAAVSKQTVYKNFADKEHLFSDIVQGVAANSEAVIADLTAVLQTPVRSAADLAPVLTELARRYLDAVLAPHVLALRRLVIAEADRFPELARDYYERAPARGIELIASALRGYAGQGLLHMQDARLAASHFAYLVLSIPQDRALFCPGEKLPPAQRDHLAIQAVRVFLAAYGTHEAGAEPPVRSG